MEEPIKKVEPLDVSISNLWYAWRKFRKGKSRTAELEAFTYYLEYNLFHLAEVLQSDSYWHGGYKIFYVTDNKKRRIAVASIQDRVVHRLLYEYLVPIFDPTFIADVWSCRKGKGLLGAIERTQQLLHRYPQSFVWRSDVVRFFDNVDRDILFGLLQKKINDDRALRILREVIKSSLSRERERDDYAKKKEFQSGI
jgi:RNA-directed DNA polymerase